MEIIMPSLLVYVLLQLLLTAMVSAVPATPPNPTTSAPPLICPTNCSCLSSLTCSDLGEQSHVLDFSDVVAPTFSFLQFVGRTKIRTIQTRAFSGLSVRQLQLDSLGARIIQREAFRGISDLRGVDVRHNQISGTVDSGTFAVDVPLESLDFSHNDIESLSGDAFALAGKSTLTDLRLAGNRLTVLPEGVFASLTRLEHLDLSGNQLTNITSPLFDDLFSLKRLFLAENRISHLDPTVFNSLLRLEQLALDNNELSMLPTSVFSRLTSLQTLTLQGNRLSAVHAKVFSAKYRYPSLATLRLDRNRISDLWQVQISNLTSLETLTLSANHLTAIPTRYFVRFNNISVLDLSRNNISSELRSSRFEGLTSLLLLNLSSNNIRRMLAKTYGASLLTLDLSKNGDMTYIKVGVFEDATGLTNLYLRSNSLSSVGRGIFSGIVSLEKLDLSDNAIRYAYSGSFQDLPSLRQVDLSRNYLLHIPNNFFVNTSLLSHVALDENRLRSIPVDIMSNTSYLQNFTLTHNGITKLQALQSRSVFFLYLTGNSISDIVDGAFNGTPQIQQLHLGQNKLTRIRATMFSGLLYLDRLDLSDNLISTIDVGSFPPTRYLSYLNLRGNRLTSIEPGTFMGVLGIGSLDLSANRLASNFAGLWESYLPVRDLILDDNDIVSFNVTDVFNSQYAPPRLSLRRNMISELHVTNQLWFTFLDLGENQITDGIFHSLQYMNILKTLKLDGNDIRGVPTVRGLADSLTELDLSNNALTDSALPSIVQLRQLQQLRLDGNSFSDLSTADWGLLADSLSVLSLSNNRLTSLDQIDRLRSLTQLNVDNNLIKSIRDATFRPLFDLDVVSLRGNRLTTIGRATLDGLEQRCTQLDLSSNDVRSVHPAAFHRLKNVTRLNLSNNAISEMILPAVMDQLTELLLSNNRLSRFPDGLRVLRSISVLSLHNNMVQSMPLLDVGNEFGVSLVDFSYNRLRDVNDVRFVGSLDVIDLSDNELVDVGVDVLADATFIGTLNLSNNALRRLPAAVALAVDRIARLDVSGCSLTSLDNWVVKKWPQTRLVELLLSGNRLTVLPSIVVGSVRSSMKHLDVSGNLLSTLERQVFQYTAVERLSLAGNPWNCDCELAWLRGRISFVDNATCWTPSETTGQRVVCYDVDDCVLTDQYQEDFPPNENMHVCETVVPPDAGPTVSNVWPLFGPQAGGTLVTVTGRELTESQQPMIVFVLPDRDHFVILPTNTTQQYRNSDRGQHVTRPTYISARQLTGIDLNSSPEDNTGYLTPFEGCAAGDERYLDMSVGIKSSDACASPQLQDLSSTDSVRESNQLPVNDYYNINHYKISESTLVGKTPSFNTTDEELLVVVHYVDKALVNTTRYFVYRQNPDITDIRPLSHLLSGGTTVTVTGQNVDAAAQPSITVTVVVTRFNSTDVDEQITATSERCMVLNSSVMTCLMPEVRLPSEFEVNDTRDQKVAAGGGVTSRSGGPDGRDRADVYVGLMFDGFNDYANLTAALPQVTMQFFQPPTFDTADDLLIYRPQSFRDIGISGKNLQRGIRISDYRIVIGKSECKVSFLSDNLLTFRPPYNEPERSHDDPFCGDFNSILVHVGNAATFLYGCIRYETEELNLAWIIGLVVGLGVLLFLVIAVVVVCVYRRRGIQKQAADDNSNVVEMSPVEASRVDPVNPVLTNSAEIQQPPVSSDKSVILEKGAEGYLDLIADEDYVGKSAMTSDGYLAPVEDSPGPQQSYLVLLPCSPTSHNGDVGQILTGIDLNSSPDDDTEYLTPSEGCAAGDERYLDMSVGIKSSDACASPQLQDLSSTDSVRESNQLPVNEYYNINH